MRKHIVLGIFILMSILFLGFVLAENNASVISQNATPVCTSPACEGAFNTGDLDAAGCPIYACPTTTSSICEDSDGGLNYFVNGSASYNNRTQTDYCINNFRGYNLIEYICTPNIDRSFDIQWRGFNCPNGCSNGACIQNININSTCTDSDGGLNYYIKGTATGLENGQIVTSTDGCRYDDKTLAEVYCSGIDLLVKQYTCPNSCSNGACIKRGETTETVTCIFKGTGKEHKCYTTDVAKAECNGAESCSIKFTAEKGEKVTWKSSCGGYQYTIQDGNDESIVFDCTAGQTNTSQVTNTHFRNAYWKCKNGKEYNEGGESSCKPYGLWKKYAISSCGSPDEVVSFSMLNGCYSGESIELVKPSVISTEGASENDCNEYLKECKLGNKETCNKWETNCQTKPSECTVNSDCQQIKVMCGEKPCEWQCKNNQCIRAGINNNEEILNTLICRDSCPLDNKCYPFGFRKSNKYCADSGNFINQSESNAKCENNFECSTNVCVSGQCVSQGLIDKILSWFTRLFGKE